MGIQGFFSYLEKNCETAITEIKPWEKYDKEDEYELKIIKWQERYDLPEFNIIMFDFQSIVYTVFNTYSEINDLMILLDTIKTEENYKQYHHDSTHDPEKKEFIPQYNDIDNKIKNCIQNFLIFWNKLGNLEKYNIPEYNFTICIELFNILKEKTNDINFIEEVLIEDVFYKILQLICDYKHTPYNLIYDENIKNLKAKFQDQNLSNGVRIYFDGIPSISKIKEQLKRRIEDDISSQIDKNIKTITGLGEDSIYSKFIKMPKVGHNTEIVKKFKNKFTEFNIFCNNIENEPDEAEHQIMKDIFKYKENLNDANIIIISPDADLIILGLIQNAKYNFNIYIHKLEAIYKGYHKFNKPEYAQQTFILEYYINIKLLREHIFFNINGQKINNQQLLDLCFILLLIGDDFISAMDTLSQAKVLPHFIEIFSNIIRLNPNFKIIEQCGDKYILNQYNFIRYIKELQKKEKNIYEQIIYINDKGKSELQLYDLDFKWGEKNSNFEDNLLNNYIYYFDNNSPIQKYLYYKLALEKFIFLKNNTKYDLLKGKHKFDELDILYKREENKKKDDDMVINYLEGCKFIFDLYFNNEIKDYQWYYKYEQTPILKNILQYSKENKNIFKNFTFNYNNKVFNEDQYNSFSENNKKIIMINIINNIIEKAKGDIITNVANIEKYQQNTRITQTYVQKGNQSYTQQKINYNITDDQLNELKKIYLIYSNIPIIYNCFNKKYLDKCIDINTELLDFSNIGKQSGGYKEKYLKYKTKYLKLKQSLN